MFKKELPIIFIGLSVVAAALVLGWTVFVEREAAAPVQAPVASDENETVPDDIVSNDVVDDVSDGICLCAAFPVQLFFCYVFEGSVQSCES